MVNAGAMQNYDVKTERKDLYGARRGDFVIVDVPPLQFLMIDGHGDPNTETSYREAVEALYTLSYAVRAVARRAWRRCTRLARWRGCGQPTTSRCSGPATRPHGTGR
jgi:hypothetical protein